MSLYVACQCGQAFNAPPELAGQTLPCPSCQRPLTVPGGAPAPELAPLGMTPGHDPFAIGSAGASPSQFGGDPFGGPAPLGGSIPGGFGAGADPFGGNMAMPAMPAGLAPGPQPQQIRGEEDSPLLVWGSILGGGGALLLVIGLLIYNGTRKRNPAAATSSPAMSTQTMPTPESTSPPMTTPAAAAPMPTSPPSATMSPMPMSPMPAAETPAEGLSNPTFMPPATGQMVASQAGEYEVWFPAEPLKAEQPLPGDAGKVSVTMHASLDAGASLMVLEMQLPAAVPLESLEVLLGTAAAQLVPGAGEPKKSRIKYHGLDAQEQLYQSGDGATALAGRTVLFVVEKTAFALTAYGPGTYSESEEAKTFFASFRQRASAPMDVAPAGDPAPPGAAPATTIPPTATLPPG